MGFCPLLDFVVCVPEECHNGALTLCVVKIILLRLCNIIKDWGK